MGTAVPLGPALVGNDPTTTPTNGSLAQRWNQWLAAPENQTALVQFGVNMLQPRQSGDTLGGQIGRAIGAGAAARSRAVETAQKTAASAQEQELAREEAARAAAEAPSRIALNTAQASYYGFGGRNALTDAQDQVGFQKFLEAIGAQPLPGQSLTPDQVAAYTEQYKVWKQQMGLDQNQNSVAAATGTPTAASKDAVIAQAKQAIDAGRDKAAVIARVQQLGFDTTELQNYVKAK